MSAGKTYIVRGGFIRTKLNDPELNNPIEITLDRWGRPNRDDYGWYCGISGLSPNELVGTHLDFQGDFNGDGNQDLLIGAPKDEGKIGVFMGCIP